MIPSLERKRERPVCPSHGHCKLGEEKEREVRQQGGRTLLPGSPATELVSLHLSSLEGTVHAQKGSIQTKERQRSRVYKTHYSLSRVCEAINSKLHRDILGRT